MAADSSKLPVSDVRMRGFAQRTTVEAALSWVDATVAPLPGEPVPLWAAAGRVLASAVTSTVAVPSFARSMMDGYALHAADTQGASAYNRLELAIVGEALPGRPFAGQVERGQAIRIMTGAPMPAGADAVLPAERVEAIGERLFALDEVPPAKNVGRAGEDVTRGDVVLPAGRVLRPQDVGLLSSIGHSAVQVVRRPRVRILVTGNELLPAGTPPSGSQIADANGPMLAALVVRDGGVPMLGKQDHAANSAGPPAEYLVPDEPAAILAAMQDERADLVLVSGGSSVGQEDHAPILLAQHGNLAIHGIAMRPSSPTGMGTIRRKPVFLLPGNPVSCLCAYDFFAGRAVRLFGGGSANWPYRSLLRRLARKLVSQVGRVDYARVRLVDGQAEPIAISGASILTSTTQADGFVVIPADSEGYPPGTDLEIFLYDCPLSPDS